MFGIDQDLKATAGAVENQQEISTAAAQNGETPATGAPESSTAHVERPVIEDHVGASENCISQRHAEAGRKGANRVHQLIREGLLYEEEHGLKRGRQRLRQLIEEGKLYEQEHGLSPDRPQIRRRLSRAGREQLMLTLFEVLLKVSRPAFRNRLRQVIDGLTRRD